MVTKNVLLLVLLASPSVFCQTKLPQVEKDNRSQVSLQVDHDVKPISATIDKDNAKDENEAVTKTIKIQRLVENIRLTTFPKNEKENDVTAEPDSSEKQESKPQIPIFMDQHMMKVIEKQMNQQDKDQAKSEAVTEIAVKPEPNQQVPIFMDQYLFKVADKGMKEQSNHNDNVEVTTEAESVKADKPTEVDNHGVPPFMDQQMMKGIIDFNKEVEKLRQHKDEITPRPNIHIPEPKDHYKNSMYLEGHHRDTLWHSQFASVLSSVMNNEMWYGENSISVYPLATSFEYTSTGHKLTRIEYVVTYNGRVLAEYEVTKTLSRPRPSQSLSEGLKHIHMHQYTGLSGQTATDSTTHSKMQAYLTPVIITIVTLAVVLILLILVVVIHVKRNRAEPPKPKDKKQLMKYILQSDTRAPTAVEPIKPPPYSAENPAYEV